MNELWPLLLVLGAITLMVILFRRRNRRHFQEERSLYMPRIQGFMVMSPLHPRMTRGCLFDLGMQYGQGFRRKEGPTLPHGPDCQCRTTPFSLSSNEVFTGSLRRMAEIQSADPALPEDARKPLLAALKRVNAEPVPGTLTEYLALVGTMDGLAAEHQEPVRRFLEARYAYLQELPEAAHPPANPAATQPTDGTSTSD